ncbi:MAG: hypothetical protein LBF22_10845 [Deltaproteobacteria bacterium]|nr:hypothetical protein [Deltaproteobacteria bacterium]
MRKNLVQFTFLFLEVIAGHQGELRKKEGENIFGSRCRTSSAITILIKNPHSKEKTKIYYHDIGDYLTRQKKLEIVDDYHDIKNQNLE